MEDQRRTNIANVQTRDRSTDRRLVDAKQHSRGAQRKRITENVDATANVRSIRNIDRKYNDETDHAVHATQRRVDFDAMASAASSDRQNARDNTVASVMKNVDDYHDGDDMEMTQYMDDESDYYDDDVEMTERMDDGSDYYDDDKMIGGEVSDVETSRGLHGIRAGVKSSSLHGNGSR